MYILFIYYIIFAKAIDRVETLVYTFGEFLVYAFDIYSYIVTKNYNHGTHFRTYYIRNGLDSHHYLYNLFSYISKKKKKNCHT